MEGFLIGALVCVCILGSTISIRRGISGVNPKPPTLPPQPPPKINIDLSPLQKNIENIPNKVLQSIQGSVNVQKGKVGELIGYLQLQVLYDRIIPLGNIVDFVCIRFPNEDAPGCIDFVDVKTGTKKRLSADQRALQKLIDEKKINFIKMKVETSASKSTES